MSQAHAESQTQAGANSGLALGLRGDVRAPVLCIGRVYDEQLQFWPARLLFAGQSTRRRAVCSDVYLAAAISGAWFRFEFVRHSGQ
jgi:hypothetical protein